MNKIKFFFKDLRLKYHICWRNSTCVDNFTNSAGTSIAGGTWTTNVYKCKICGKISHID
jgi:hypothetical protein